LREKTWYWFKTSSN